MGAKDDKPGNILTPMTGKISAFKLVYVSGKVGCVDLPTSNWGCGASDKIFTIITDDKNNVVFPENYNNQRYYKLPGFTVNSPELLSLFLFHSPGGNRWPGFQGMVHGRLDSFCRGGQLLRFYLYESYCYIFHLIFKQLKSTI